MDRDAALSSHSSASSLLVITGNNSATLDQPPAFAILLGAYRALYFAPYELSRNAAPNLNPNDRIFFEFLLALIPAFVGATLLYEAYAPLRLLFGAGALAILSALPLFAHTIREENLLKNSVLISPDMGGIRRIKQMSEMLDGLPYAVLEKDRNLDTGNVAIVRIEGEVAKRALIVDDMISSGGTIVKAADFLRQRGVEEIVIFVTHAVFSKEAPKLLQESLITKVYVTDSVYVSEEKRFAKLEILSLADMMATSLRDHEVTKQSF